MNAWAFIAIGMPAPQGSKKGFVNPKNGRVIITDDSKKTKPWQQIVRDAAPLDVVLEGPVAVHCVFTMSRPKSAKKTQHYPMTKPDIDKLQRSTFDAVTHVGIWKDDAAIAHLLCAKVWTGYDPYALEIPGVLIGAVAIDSFDTAAHAGVHLRELIKSTLTAHRDRYATHQQGG